MLTALIGIAAVLGGGEFEERHARVLGTAAAGLLCGGTALAGLATAEAAPRQPLGWAVLAAAPTTFLVLVVGIWWEEGWDRHTERLGRAVLTALAVLAGALIVGALRRSVRLALPAVRLLFWAVVTLVALTTAFAVAAIWVPSVDEVGRQTQTVDRVERSLVALFVAIVVSFLLGPVVERALTALAHRGQRVDRGPA